MNLTKKLFLTLCLPLVLFGSAAANPKEGGDPWLERLGVVLIAQQFKLDPAVVSDSLTWGPSVFEVVPVYAIYKHVHKPPREIWALRKDGLSWGQIAKKMGTRSTMVTKLAKAGLMDASSTWNVWINRRYGLKNAQILYLRRLGFNWSEIAGIAHLSFRSGAGIKKVVQQWQVDQNWSKVRSHFGVTDDWGPGHWHTSWVRGKPRKA